MPKGNARQPEDDQRLLESLNNVKANNVAGGMVNDSGVAVNDVVATANKVAATRRTATYTTATRADRRERATRNVGMYDYFIGKLAMLIGLVIVAGIWYLGARFTLVWIQDRGVDVASWGLFAWLVPGAVTAFQFGVLRSGTRSPAVMGLWLVIVLFDIVTTGLGLQSTVNGMTVASMTFGWDLNSLALCLAGGAIIALVPEPASRALVKELFA